MKHTHLTILACLIVIAMAPGFAQAQMGYEAPSLEWLVADSDVVVRATIIEVESNPVPNPDPHTYRNAGVRKTVTISVLETLKGEHAEALTLAEGTLASNRMYEGWQIAQTELIWFLKRKSGQETGSDSALEPHGVGWSVIRLGAKVPEEDGWTSLPPPIFNMGLEVLTDPEVILQAARLAADTTGKSAEPQSYLIDLPATIMARSGKSGDANRLTVPVDARLEALAHRLINAPAAFLRDGEERLNTRLRLEGVKALRHFPSAENRRLLRALPIALTTQPEREQVIVEEIKETARDILQEWALDVQLLPYPEARSLFNRNPVLVRFTNRDTQGIRILRPLDGSEWSWHMPYYQFTVCDAEGKKLELSPRCGNSGLWANRDWPNDYMILLGPGDSYEMQVGISHVIPTDGEYTVQFEYIYDPAIASKSDIEYPDGLWVGHARSEKMLLALSGLE